MSNECPVCNDHYAHTTQPPENESSVSGMHVCYTVEDGNQLVMYIHGERQSIHGDADEFLGGGPCNWKEANSSAEELFDGGSNDE